ncbi:hypothetical protein RBB50_011115 [Rhinocladiella similis]
MSDYGKHSPKGSPKQVDKEQPASSAASNGSSRTLSAQDSAKQTGTSTENAWDFVERTESLFASEFPASTTEVPGTTVAQAGQTATGGNGDFQDQEQHHPSAAHNGDSEEPSTQDTTEQAGMSTLRDFGFIRPLDPQSLEIMGFRTSGMSVPTTLPAQAGRTATSSNGESQEQDPQARARATSQSDGMSFIHPFNPDMFNQSFPRTDSK